MQRAAAERAHHLVAFATLDRLLRGRLELHQLSAVHVGAPPKKRIALNLIVLLVPQIFLKGQCIDIFLDDFFCQGRLAVRTDHIGNLPGQDISFQVVTEARKADIMANTTDIDDIKALKGLEANLAANSVLLLIFQLLPLLHQVFQSSHVLEELVHLHFN